MKIRMAGAAGLAFLMMLAGCASAEDSQDVEDREGTGLTETIQQGGTLRAGIVGEPGALDPTLQSGPTGAKVLRNACRYLYDAYADGEVVPVLAAGMPEMSEDGLVATVRLREDVLFQDGTPLNAEAAKLSFERNRDHPGTGRSGDVAQVEDVLVVDEYTLEYHLNVAYSSETGAAYIRRAGGYVLSPTALAEMGDEQFGKTPICVGPFKIVSHVPNVEVRLVKDEHYYDADQVHLDEIIYRPIADSNVRLTNLMSGDLDVMEEAPASDLVRIDADSNLRAMRTPGIGFYYLRFNLNKPNSAGEPPGPMGTNNLLRQALELSIDREAISQTVFAGEFPPACGFMYATSPVASDKTMACSEYDPERARELLAEAGVELPVRFEILINQQPEFRRMAEMVQAMGAETGFDIEINIQEQVSLVDALGAGDFDSVMRTWGGQPDPDITITRFAHSSFAYEMGEFVSERADELIEAARASGDRAERIELYEDLDEYLKDEALTVYLVRPAHLFAHRSNVTGVQAYANGHMHLAYAGFTS